MDYIYESCEKRSSVSIGYVKYLLEKYYTIKDQVHSGKINSTESEKIWKEEAENFIDNQYELRRKLIDTTYKGTSKETLAALKLIDEVHDAAIFNTVPKFFNHDLMPSDS